MVAWKLVRDQQTFVWRLASQYYDKHNINQRQYEGKLNAIFIMVEMREQTSTIPLMYHELPTSLLHTVPVWTPQSWLIRWGAES